MRDNYAAKARDEHLTKLDNALYIIIALVDIKTSKYLSKANDVWNKARDWKKIKYTIPTFLLISWNSRYMVRITATWLSVKYQNFFCFQNVTSPPNAVNVPFISSYIKISRPSLEPNLSTWQFCFPCGLFFVFVFVFYVLFCCCCFFLTEAEFNSFFKGNSSCIEELLYKNVRNWIGFPASWVLV